MAFSIDVFKQKVKELSQTGMELAQAGVDKSVQMAAIAKLKAANLKEENDMRNAYAELGKMYFADHAAAPEESYAAVCAQIAEIQASIAANNAKIAELKVTPEVDVEVEVETVEAEAEAVEAEEPAAEAAETEEVAEEAPAAEEEKKPAEEEEENFGFTD